MAAGQTIFSVTAQPMDRWRRELTAKLDSTFNDPEHYFASARTGSDWHSGLYPGYVTWIRSQGSWNLQVTVDQALYNGFTVAAKAGGLASVTLRYGGVPYAIGQRITGRR